MTQPREPLVGYHITSPNAVFVERVESAATAGYVGLGLEPRDRQHVLPGVATDTDHMRALDRAEAAWTIAHTSTTKGIQ